MAPKSVEYPLKIRCVHFLSGWMDTELSRNVTGSASKPLWKDAIVTRNVFLRLGCVAILMMCGALKAVEVPKPALPVDRVLDEPAARDEFMKSYWDIVSDTRLRSLDYLRDMKEDKSLWLLYAVSYWDYEPRVRRRAFTQLVESQDQVGYISYLSARSFRQEIDADQKAWKANAMRRLDYKWEPLNALTGFIVRQKYPGYANNYGGYGSTCPWHSHRVDLCRGTLFCSGIWRHNSGHGFGGIAVAFGSDWDQVNDNRRNLTSVLDSINYLSGSEFKLRPGVEEKVRKWWENRGPEFLEIDRRTRQGREDARKVREHDNRAFSAVEENNQMDLRDFFKTNLEKQSLKSAPDTARAGTANDEKASNATKAEMAIPAPPTAQPKAGVGLVTIEIED